MVDIPRLNGMIRCFEEGKPCFGSFATPDIDVVLAMAGSKYDSIIFEMEHNIWDIRALRDGLQYMLNRRQIVEKGSIAPNVTPLVRIPANGNEKNQWLAKQALDLGAFGIIWPHVDTVEQAYNAVAACRYPRLKSAARYEPAGIRGDSPTQAARFWGLNNQEYYKKADVWPLDPNGEILVGLMIEGVEAVNNLDDMLKNVPGIGFVLVGEGDLSQELGYPRQYEHPVVLEHIARVVATCRKYKVPVGHPHVDGKNVERVLSEGFSYLMTAPVRTFGALDKGRELAKR
jgi:4-hydroxy-2-oxoheptanedioate aldolase